MQRIPTNVVEKIWLEMSDMNEDDLPVILNDLSENQPLLMAYLLSAGEDILNEDEQELLFYLGTAVWQMMKQGDKEPPELTEPMLDAVEEKNVQMMEYLGDEAGTSFEDTLATILEGYNQPDILKYIVEALVEEDPNDESEIREENLGLMMFYLKVAIDCLDI